MLKYILLIAITTSLSFQSNETVSRRKRSELVVPITTFRTQNLNCHNKYRKQHGARPLTMSDKLNKLAQEHAEKLAKTDGRPEASTNPYNEMTHMSRGYMVDGNSACESWYRGEAILNHTQQDSNVNYLSSTARQMISRHHCSLGVGVAKGKSGSVYVVANYDPPGNVDDELSKETLTPLDVLTMDTSCSDSNRDTYLKQNLDCLNLIRRMYGVPPLIYKEEMNKYAETQAASFAKENSTKPLSGYNSYNMFTIQFGRKDIVINGYETCKSFYNDGKDRSYQFYVDLDKTASLNNPAKSFTQIIWKSTKFTGFGVARSKNGTLYSVSVFDPPGNIKGDYRTNLVRTQAWPTVPTLPTTKRLYPTRGTPTTKLLYPTRRTPTTTPTTVLPRKDPSRDEIFRNENLLCHNEYRVMHSVQPLAYTPELNEYAQIHAEWLAKSDRNMMTTIDSTGFNVYTTTQDDINGFSACRHWYMTSELYDYNEHWLTAPKDTLPFTSMVWRHTRFTGIGTAKSASGKTYITAIYDPRGNGIGQFEANVLPPVIRDEPGNSNAVLLLIGGMRGSDESVVIDTEMFFQQNLDCHNSLRNRYGAPPLKIDDELMFSAKEAVDRLAEHGLISLQDSSMNYFVSDSHTMNGYTACKTWHAGVKWHKSTTSILEEKQLSLMKSFRRMTKRDMTKMGCALSVTKSKMYFVCQYGSRYDYDLLPRRGDAASLTTSLFLCTLYVFLVRYF